VDKQINYQRLMIKAFQQKDTRVIKYIDKPDPIIEPFLEMLKRKVVGFFLTIPKS
jgi:hypothetical protein